MSVMQNHGMLTFCLAYYEFSDVFIEKGQDEYMLNILKHFCDYFMKCYPEKNKFYYQVGDVMWITSTGDRLSFKVMTDLHIM